MGLECYSACCGENQIWVGVEWTVVADEGYECIYDVKKDRAIFFRNIQGWLNEARNDAVAELLGQIRSSEGEYIQFFDTSVSNYLWSKAEQLRARFGAEIPEKLDSRALDVTWDYNEMGYWPDQLPFPVHLLPAAKAILRGDFQAADHMLDKVETFPNNIWTDASGESFVLGASDDAIHEVMLRKRTRNIKS